MAFDGEKIGGLWINTATNGNQYLSGSIKINEKDFRLLIFVNKHKKGKQPDYTVFCKNMDEFKSNNNNDNNNNNTRNRQPGDDDEDITVEYTRNEKGEPVTQEFPF